MAKVSFRIALASRESVFDVQTSTTRKNHRSGHSEGRLTTTPSGCCVRKGTPCGRSACIRVPFPVEPVPRVPQHPPDEMPDEGATTGDITRRPPSRASERAGRQLLRSCPGRSGGVAADQPYAPATASEGEAMNRRSRVRIIKKCLCDVSGHGSHMSRDIGLSLKSSAIGRALCFGCASSCGWDRCGGRRALRRW